jgi:hypothetical protein
VAAGSRGKGGSGWAIAATKTPEGRFGIAGDPTLRRVWKYHDNDVKHSHERTLPIVSKARIGVANASYDRALRSIMASLGGL